MRWRSKLLCVLLVGLLGLQPAGAGDAAVKKSAPAKDAAKASAALPSPKVAIPSGPKLRMLIYTTLIALNQANLTGNYSVVRDLAAPGFRERTVRRGFRRSLPLCASAISICRRSFCSIPS